MKIIHTGDTHIDSTFFSKVNPATGLDTEWESNARALASAVEAACEHQAACFIHAGDAFKNGRPSPEAAMLLVDTLRPLVDNGIPVVLADGNHEMLGVPPAQRTMTGLVAQALTRSGSKAEVHLVDRQPELVRTSTGLQVVVLPWLSKASLLADMPAAEVSKLSPEDSDKAVIAHAKACLDKLFAAADDSVELVLTGHITVDKTSLSTGARGSELDFVHPFSEPIMPVAELEEFPYSYAGLSHIHTAQKVGARTFYAGSPNRHTLHDAGMRKTFNIVEVGLDRAKVKRVDSQARAMVRLGVGDDIPEGALVALALEPGMTEVPAPLAQAIAEAGSRLVRVIPAPPDAPAQLAVSAPSERVHPLKALRQALEHDEHDNPERVMSMARVIATKAGL